MLTFHEVEPYHGMATHEAFFCPACGELWARLLTAQASNPWQVTARHCPACKDVKPRFHFSALPGSLINPVEARFDGHGAAHLPLPALIREFELHAAIDSRSSVGHNTPTNDGGPMSSDIEVRIAALRQKVVEGTATAADLREGLALCRVERLSAATDRAESKAKKVAPDGAAVLARLMGKQQP